MKRLFAVLMSLCLLLLAGCSPLMLDFLTGGRTGPADVSGAGSGQERVDGDYTYEDDAVQTKVDSTYFNDYIGVSFTLPKGWWVYELSTDNFSTAEGETADPAALDLYSQDGYSFFWMLSAANLQYSYQDDHVGFMLLAEKDEELPTLQDWSDYYEQQVPFDYTDDVETCIHLDSSMTEIGGRTFAKQTFSIDQAGGDTYTMLYLTCEAGNGYFLNFSATYWDSNPDAASYLLGFAESCLRVSDQ